jgi:hypothetical protein
MMMSCESQANKSDFFKRGKIPNDFRARHTLLTLHIWILNRRLIRGENADGVFDSQMKYLQESLFDRFWEDTTRRIRAEKVPELTINKHLKDVQAYTFTACVTFDYSQTYASAEHPPEKALHTLGDALWEQIYKCNNDLSDDHILRLARYVLRELDNVKNMKEEDFLDGRISWGKPPSWTDVVSNNGEIMKNEVFEGGEEEDSSSSEDGEKELEELPENWRLAYTEGGDKYWWNVQTRESTWIKPTPDSNYWVDPEERRGA